MKKKNNFKRVLSIFLVVSMMLFAFSACSENGEDISVTVESSDSESSIESNASEGVNSDSEASDISNESNEDSSEVSENSEISEEESSEESVNNPEDESSADVSDDESDDSSNTEEDEPTEDKNNAFRLSSIDDITDSNGTRSYTVFAPYTDKYTLECNGVSEISISQNGKKLKSAKDKITVSLKEGEVYTLTVETKEADSDFKITTTAKEHLVTLPYDVATPVDISNIELNSTVENPLVAAEVNYIKRKGGTYVYSNNPEMFGAQHVGQAFMRNEGLSGEVYVTFEHANYSGKPVYLGYQLKNETDHDVYITVTNVGYQWAGTWFGQLAWYNFYNTAFKLPSDYFTANGSISSKYSGLDYAYSNYTPRVYQPMTYRLPAGEYIWVIGGTTGDSYRNINVDNSANHLLGTIRCANGNVKFNVTGGEVTGTMYCYDNISQVKAEPKALGYVAGNYSQQYSGIAYHHGVIDNYMSWTFNDNVGSGMLPVKYTNYFDNYVPANTMPYKEYNNTAHTITSNSWMTHLNPQNNNTAVGMDMVEFIWHDKNGNEVVIDNYHADGGGTPANTANWMIEYQDHFTLVNQGDKERTVTLHLRDHGTLAILVRDSKTGEVLEASYTAGLGESNGVFSNYTYKVTIPPHSVKQITLDYLLVACSYGSVVHAASIE